MLLPLYVHPNGTCILFPLASTAQLLLLLVKPHLKPHRLFSALLSDFPVDYEQHGLPVL